MELVGKLLQGLAERDDAETYAKLLNGPTMDRLFERKDVTPCGCGGKA